MDAIQRLSDTQMKAIIRPNTVYNKEISLTIRRDNGTTYQHTITEENVLQPLPHLSVPVLEYLGCNKLETSGALFLDVLTRYQDIFFPIATVYNVYNITLLIYRLNIIHSKEFIDIHKLYLQKLYLQKLSLTSMPSLELSIIFLIAHQIDHALFTKVINEIVNSRFDLSELIERHEPNEKPNYRILYELILLNKPEFLLFIMEHTVLNARLLTDTLSSDALLHNYNLYIMNSNLFEFALNTLDSSGSKKKHVLEVFHWFLRLGVTADQNRLSENGKKNYGCTISDDYIEPVLHVLPNETKPQQSATIDNLE